MWGTGVWGVFLACVRRVFFLNINAVGAVFPPQVEFFWFMMWTVEHTSYFRFFFSIIARSDFEEPSTKHFNIDFFSGKLTTDSENTSAYDT